MAITAGTNLSTLNAPAVANQFSAIIPVVQAQDGSYVGTVQTGDPSTPEFDMVAFDQSGNLRWTVPNEQPQIATADGGVIGQSGITYDQNGNVTGQIANLPTYAWPGNAYNVGSVDQVVSKVIDVAKSFWPFRGANNSGNATAVQQPWYAPLKSCPGAPTPCPQEAITSALGALKTLLQSPCPACQVWVFNKLAGTSQSTFLNFLSRPPRLYDGTRSYAPQHVAFCPTGFFNQFFGSFPAGDKTVRDYIQQNGADAVSQTPADKGKGMQVFFNPATGICNVLSLFNPQSMDRGVLNQATLFHEALHGYTGQFDLDLESAFGVSAPSFNVTTYLEGHVILATGATACTN